MITKKDNHTLIRFFENRPFKKGSTPIEKYAETTYLPSGKYRGVRFSHSRAPYLREPLSLLSPESEYQEVRCQFPAQTGKSTIAEMFIEYYIAEHPTEILYVTSNETAAIKFMQRRIEPRCALKGIEFRADTESKSARRTGDTAYSKSFNGGNLDIASSLSPSQLASESKKVVVGDETDRWRLSIGDEGNPLDIMYARTQAWGDEKKILLISTPTSEQNSLIHKLFLDGDQRLYYVPCVHCGFKQLLDFNYGRGHGLMWKYKNGNIDRRSISYVCESCGKEIRESKKAQMLIDGEWRKTALSKSDFIASFHINGLYSPFISWYDMVVAYEEAETSAVKKQAFDNLKMGRPHRESGSRPKTEKLIENRGRYKSGEVPEGVLYLTAFIDVQRGSGKDPNNPARLEMEVLGIGYGYRTWSIEYRKFNGPVTDPYSGAWEDLHQYALSTGLKYIRTVDGFQFPVAIVLIDSGDGENTDIVYRFSQRWGNTFPSKGYRSIKRRKGEKPDEMTESSFKRYRAAKMGEDMTLYEISTIYYKNHIYNALKIERVPVDPQPPGFCDFPRDYGESYFDGLVAEEKMADGSFDAKGRRNEPLDCRVGCLAGADIFLDSELYNLRAWAKSEGRRPEEIQQITHRTVIDNMIDATRITKKM